MKGEVDAIVFTGGIGENSAEIRRRVCVDLNSLNLMLDQDANMQTVNDRKGKISSNKSKLHAYVIPTNEE